MSHTNSLKSFRHRKWILNIVNCRCGRALNMEWIQKSYLQSYPVRYNTAHHSPQYDSMKTCMHMTGGVSLRKVRGVEKVGIWEHGAVFSGVHQTHEVCQCLPWSYALVFLMHRAHGTLWIAMRSRSQTWRVHMHTNTLRRLQRETLLITPFLNCTRDKITAEIKKISRCGLWLEAVVPRDRRRREGARLIFHLFIRHACRCALCTCHTLSFIITAVRRRAVSPLLVHIRGMERLSKKKSAIADFS